jgi:hypothetical protein
MHVLRVKCHLCFSAIATKIEVVQQFLTEILKKLKKFFQGLSGFYMRTDGLKDRF